MPTIKLAFPATADAALRNRVTNALATLSETSVHVAAVEPAFAAGQEKTVVCAVFDLPVEPRVPKCIDSPAKELMHRIQAALIKAIAGQFNLTVTDQTTGEIALKVIYPEEVGFSRVA